MTVLDDGSAVCEYRYERAEYTITWDAGEGELTGTDYSTGKVKYGQTITAPGLDRAIQEHGRILLIPCLLMM